MGLANVSKRLGSGLMGLLLAALAHAASVSLPNGPVASPGDTVLLPITLSSAGQAVSALQFDLNWDPVFSVNVAAGVEIGSSSKSLHAVLPQARILRCLVAGMNGNAVADGEVLRVFVTIPSYLGVGTGQLSLTNLSAAAANGTPVPLTGNSATVQIQPGGVPQLIQPTGFVNGASLLTGPVSPGEIITLFGSISTMPAISFNGVPAPIIYAGQNQVNAVVPFALDVSGPAQVVIQQGSTVAQASVAVAVVSPAIFTLSTTGTGPGAILNQDYSVNTSSTPAARGSVLMVYATGFGGLTPLPPDGLLATVLATPPLPVTATIDGVAAEVTYAGAAPGLINGAIQVNVRVPDAVRSNPAAPISLAMGQFVTQPGVTVAIQ